MDASNTITTITLVMISVRLAFDCSTRYPYLRKQNGPTGLLPASLIFSPSSLKKITNIKICRAASKLVQAPAAEGVQPHTHWELLIISYINRVLFGFIDEITTASSITVVQRL